MVQVRKVEKKNKTAIRRKRIVRGSVNYKLPTEPTVPSEDMVDYSFLIYGRKKIGKTSLVSHFPKALLYMFEPGAVALSVYKIPTDGHCFNDWVDVKGYTRQMKKHLNPFSTAVFDPGNKAYDLCMQHVIKTKLDGKHPGEFKDYGASWRKVTDEFHAIHTEIASLRMAFVAIAHEKYSDFEGADGLDYVRTEPKFAGALNEFYEGIIDVIGHYQYIGKERFLQIRGDEFTIAGCRLEGKFLTPRGAELHSEICELDEDDPQELLEILRLSELKAKEEIVKIPMGSSSKMAYTNLIRAFNNQQTETFYDHDDSAKGGVLARKKKKKKFKFKRSGN